MHSKWIAGQPVCPVPAQPSGGRSAAQVEVGGVAGKSMVATPLRNVQKPKPYCHSNSTEFEKGSTFL